MLRNLLKDNIGFGRQLLLDPRDCYRLGNRV